MRKPTKRRPHFVNPTTALIEQVSRVLADRGALRCPAAPWLNAGHCALTTAQSCGWERGTTALQMVERRLATTGWAWRWEGDDLVLELPGWVPPAPGIVAIQPGLFE